MCVCLTIFSCCGGFCLKSCVLLCFATGSLKMKLKAWNVFSSVEVDVDMFASCGVDSDLKVKDHNHDLLIFDKGKDELVNCFSFFLLLK